MRIQLALDRLTREQCIQLVKETYHSIDLIEVGTGVIKEYGVAIIRELKDLFPDKPIVADMKTCDAGKHETRQALEAGASITTVMGFAADGTIAESVKVASELGGEVMIDLLGITSQERVQEIAELGATMFCLHKGKDMQAAGQFADASALDLIEEMEGVEVAIAGGISEKTIRSLKNTPITIAIVGGAITQSDYPKEIAAVIKSKIQ